MTDYAQYVGQDVVIVKELLEDVEEERSYDPGFMPFWNFVGNILHIVAYDHECESFTFIDKTGRSNDTLMPYDFEHGFVSPLAEEEEIQVDEDAIYELI